MKTKIKLLASVLCLLTVVFCIVGLTACGKGKCNHRFGEWSTTTAATCTEEGLEERTCSKCGEVETSTLEALGHDWKAATCTAPKTCKNCSLTEGSTLDHAYTESVVKDEAVKSVPTCTSAAVYYKSCSCGKVSTNKNETFTDGNALGHSFTNESVKYSALKSEATCMAAAVYYKSCFCGAVGGEDAGTFTDGSVVKHSDENKDHHCDFGCGAILGTCEDANKDAACDYGCSKVFGICEDLNKDHNCDCGCGTTFGEHSDGDDADHFCDYGCKMAADDGCYDIELDGTCDECGLDMDHTCEDTNFDHACDYGCPKTFGEHSDSSTDGDHVCDYGCNGVIEDCFDAENDGDHKCDICGNADITSHDYGDAICGMPAVCVECGAATEAALEHIDANFDHICDNNCGKNDMGEHADSGLDDDHVCDYGCGAVLENCSDIDTDNDHDCDVCGKADVTVHDYVEQTALTVEATCGVPANITYLCNCGATYTEDDGGASGHDITDVEAEERHVGGCEYVLVYTCQRKGCGEKVIGETVYHHQYVASIKTPATCKTPGLKTFVCEACGDTSKAVEVIPANETGHNWTVSHVEGGIKTETCSICRAEKTVAIYGGNKTDSIGAEELAGKEIELNDANISLDSGVIDKIGNQNVTVSADKIEGTDRSALGLTDEELAQIGDSPVYNFTINNGKENISQFGENNYATITLPYNLVEGVDVDSIAVWFINENGELESIEATYNNGFVTFKTNHFSYYTVTRLTPTERCDLYGHEYAHQHVEGSCIKDSYDLYVCIRCHDKYVDQDTLKIADGHDYLSETNEATCTESGYIRYTCADCGHSYRKKLNAPGHSWSIEEMVVATCSSDGYTKYRCENCGDTYTEIYAKPGHVYTSYVIPATCSSDGYTIHDCDNCDYKYTDSFVEALGHDYRTVNWSWESNGNKAFLNLVCTHDEDHTTSIRAEMDKEVTKGSCSNYVIRTHTATVELDGVIYTDVMVIRQGNPQHKIPDEWSADEYGHWHECMCGYKTDEGEHFFGNETVTKNPTCTEDGESIAYCECGQSKVTVIPATGEHSYVGGVCETCGQDQIICYHDVFHREYVYFGEFGACDFILGYDVCECGEVKTFDLYSLNLPCDPSESYEEYESLDEKGNTVKYMKGVCSYCGMEISAVSTYIFDGCNVTNVTSYTFALNGDVIIGDVCYENEFTQHRNVQVETMYLSDYGACGGSIDVARCLSCGQIEEIYSEAVDCNVGDAIVEEIIDADGKVVGYKYTSVCTECGFVFVTAEWKESHTVCEYTQFKGAYIYKNEECILECVQSWGETQHAYEYTYEFYGNGCEEGYYVNAQCSVCGDSDRYSCSGHQYGWREVDLGEFGLCGGSVCESYCVVCGTVFNCESNEYCYWEIVRDDNDEYDVYRCYHCNANKIVYAYDGEKEENCYYTRTEVIFYVMYGEEVYKCEKSYQCQKHDHKYAFDMMGQSCVDGYVVTITCEDCGFIQMEEYYDHNVYRVFATNGKYDACEDHNVYVDKCPCGEVFSVGFNRNSFRFDEMMQMYVCDDCDIAVSYVVDNSVEGCFVVASTYLDVYRNGAQLYGDWTEKLFANHSFTDVKSSEVDGVTIVTTFCENCGATSNTKILSVKTEDHDGEYYFDYIFTPDRSSTYTIVGLANRDTYVCLYKVVEDQLVMVGYDDDGGNENQFCLAANLTAGDTYVYRISFLDTSKKGEIDFALAEAAMDGAECRHNNSREFVVLAGGSKTCTDGILYGAICAECGCIKSAQTEYDHRQIVIDRVELAEYGACRGRFVYYSCACGENDDVYLDDCYYAGWTSNEYYDEEGKLIHVDVCACVECGLRYTSSYYTVKNRENCTRTYYYTVVINIDSTLIKELTYTRVEVDHDCTISGVLMGGVDSSCEEGVIITYQCKDCDYLTTHTSYYHENYEKERIDLAEFGSECGGYMYIYGCACGRDDEIMQEHSLCDFGEKWCNLWIEDAVTGSQDNITGWCYYDYNAYIYTCSVTDPEPCACKIRYASYWVKDEDSCVAYRYETWQFGYDEETGKCLYEVTFKTGYSVMCHNYVDGSTGNNRKYDCADCGSYYYANYYYDGDGNLIKREELISNTLDNGYDAYREYVEEYTEDADGVRYVCREYSKTIDCNGYTFWYEKLIEEEAYIGTFGEDGRHVWYTYSDSIGECYDEEYAYVYLKGYEFRIYTYRVTEGGWYRYDYTYTFEHGCTKREVYTNSEGVREEDVFDNCYCWRGTTLKDPTCSQDGLGYYKCDICGEYGDTYTVSPNDHRWVKISDNWYYCFACGLENKNGASGDIIMEDLTEQHGNGEYYVVGYYMMRYVTYDKRISLIFEDGSKSVMIPAREIEIVQMDGIRAYAISKEAVDKWAADRGYTDYSVRFSFVPIGPDSSFDYGITFTETIDVDTVINSVSFVDYVGAGETKSYTITPAEDGVWTFTSHANNDTFACLYDANGNLLVSNDDGGNNSNFKITYELKAGETYTISVNWSHTGRSGNMPLVFEQIEAE